jgi:hypothetical protein
MRPVPWVAAEPYRIQAPGYASRYGDPYGAFRIPYAPTGSKLAVLAVSGEIGRVDLGDAHAWDHVSVSVVSKNRTPNWSEMSFIKEMFWLPDETVMQLHVPASDHINIHNYTLHLWRPLLIEIPRPPQSAV